MNLKTKISLAIVLTLPLLNAFVTQVSADTMTQTVCSTASYGQTSCTTVIVPTPTPTPEVVFRTNGTPIVVHTPKNTGVDPQIMTAGIFALVLTTSGALFTLKQKLRK